MIVDIPDARGNEDVGAGSKTGNFKDCKDTQVLLMKAIVDNSVGRLDQDP